MMVTIIEANMTGIQHSYPNGVYTDIVADLFFPKHINLYCSKEHYLELHLKSNNVNYFPIQTVAGNKHMLKKFFVEYRNTFNILKYDASNCVIFLSCCPDIQYFVLRFAKKYKKKKIIIITHGELEGLLLSGKWKPWSYPFWMSICFRKKLPNNIYRIVLGENMKEYLVENFKENNIFSIDQPRDKFRTKNEVLPSVKANIFAYIGDFMKKKGAQCFIDSEKSISNDSKSELWVIGRNSIGFQLSKESKVKLKSQNGEFMPVDEYDFLISKVTYACFPYPSDSYRLTASGAVLDAIRFLKPIVYIVNPYFNAIFEDAGDIGYPCKNEYEFIKTIELIDNNVDVEKYCSQVDNLRKLQDKFKKKTIEQEIMKILEKVNE